MDVSGPGVGEWWTDRRDAARRVQQSFYRSGISGPGGPPKSSPSEHGLRISALIRRPSRRLRVRSRLGV